MEKNTNVYYFLFIKNNIILFFMTTNRYLSSLEYIDFNESIIISHVESKMYIL